MEAGTASPTSSGALIAMLTDTPADLSSVIQDLWVFLPEPLRAAAQRRTLSKFWKPGGPRA